MIKDKIKELTDRQAKIDARLEKANSSSPVNNSTPKPEQVFGSPYARKGESALTSRGFEFQRLVGAMTNIVKPEHAKVELDIAARLREVDMHSGFAGYKNAYAAPLGTELMGGLDNSFRYEMKGLLAAGVAGGYPDEQAHVARKAYGMKTNQSWIDETLGGSLVPFAEQGELIHLLRNKDALLNAGAKVIPLPPQGRLRMPRQTTASLGYWVGENQTITSTNVGTGSLVLSAKKVAALISMPNELIRFASPASEQLFRTDMTITLSLTLDQALLYGEGSDNIPLGLVNTPGISTVTPTTVAADGNTLAPQDLFLFAGAVEANNGEFEGWILRPEYFYKFVAARAGTYNGSTTAAVGPFVYDQYRQLGQGFPKNMGGYPATTTSQVSITRTKGNGTALTTLFGGMWSNFLVAMYGSIEFANADQHDQNFAQDVVSVRAILSCDGAARNPGVFAVADQLVQTLSA